ncbi:tetratricopeptide repeat-containing sulfotransferase family protein [Shimia biformata]|uniref:tetratricopeptide repeat-containing sulfotransferase family protein n=1 Tax=Shimia biformata TaxID=1294299 RepID=UPI00194F220C|nr:sulfotransferase [Shimia biformata]
MALSVYQDVLSRFPANKVARAGVAELTRAGVSAGLSDPPPEVLARLNQGFASGSFREVIIEAEALTIQFPTSAVLLRLIGAAQAAAGNLDAAEPALRKAIEIDPKSVEGLRTLGLVLMDKLEHQQAISLLEKADRMDPGNSETILALGECLVLAGRHGEAIDRFDRVTPGDTRYYDALCRKAGALAQRGDMEVAAEVLRKAIAQKPDRPPAYDQLTQVTRGRIDADSRERLFSIEITESAPVEARARLGFARARVLDAEQDFPAAFTAFKTANAAIREHRPYHPAKVQAEFRNIRETFLQDHAAMTADKRYRGPRPIFVVGMPRSGTTLVEQILGRHSAATPAGELEFLRIAVETSGWRQGKDMDAVLDHVRAEYLGRITTLASTRVLIDKMPQNFRWIGFVLLAIPEARVLHMVRDPMAVCWSNFRQQFTSPAQSYSCDLRDTIDYFNKYQSLMAFWHQRFPGRVLNVDYDQLTADPETGLVPILDHVGLTPENGLLDTQNAGVVRTASIAQVRQGIYKGSSEVWKHYAPFLQSVQDELSDLPYQN